VNKITDDSQKSSVKFWEWKYISRGEGRRVICNICSKTFLEVYIAKVHLLRAHGIDEDKIDEIDRTNVIWQYFTEEIKYSPKCKICNIVLLSGYMEHKLRYHLNAYHSVFLRELEQILTTSLYGHFEVDFKLMKASCLLCRRKYNVFKIHTIEHLTVHGVNMETRNFIKNKIFESINDSLAKVSNVDSASH